MRILAPLLRYDYGDVRRGESLEKAFFLPALASCSEVHPFWLEEHGYPDDIGGLQSRIIEEAEKISPDLVFFILMRDEIRPDTLERLGRRWLTANWFCDDQWRFEDFTRHVAPLLHYPITVDKFSLAKYRAMGCGNVILSQWASRYEPIEAKDIPFCHEVSFIGGRNGVRDWFISELRKAGIKVDCFGTGWLNGRASFEEMRTITRASKISLNLSNSQPRDPAYRSYAKGEAVASILGMRAGSNGYTASLRKAASALYGVYRSTKRVEQIKARNFEIPAWGGFELSQFAPGIEDYFVPGSEIALFSSSEELVRLSRYYLENDEEREAIRLSGNRRAQMHTYERRMREIVERIANDQGLPCRS